MIGPSCAIADVKSDKATIWCGTQGPFRSRKNIPTLLKLPEKDVRVIYHEGSGSYGRLATEDAGEDAALFVPRGRRAGSGLSASAKTSMAGHPKGRRKPTKSKPHSTATANGSPGTLQTSVCRAPSRTARPCWRQCKSASNRPTPTPPMAVRAPARVYSIGDQRIFANLINWRFAEPIPLRTSQLRAPGDIARCFATDSSR